MRQAKRFFNVLFSAVRFKTFILVIFTISLTLNIALYLHMSESDFSQSTEEKTETEAPLSHLNPETPLSHRNPETPRSHPSPEIPLSHLNPETPSHSTSEHDPKTFANQSQEKKTSCPKMTIHQKDEIEHFSKDRACSPHLPTEDTCKYTAELFTADPSIATCHDQRESPYKLCEERGNTSVFQVKCDLSACNRDSPIQLQIVGPSDGNMWQQELPADTTDEEMEKFVEKAAKKTRKSGFNFLFMACVGRKHGGTISQMLTHLPLDEIFKSHREASPEKINVNVVLLDSISRPHFYRSLPKTVKHLREKHYDPDFDAHIFDFELFQSVHGHTHENEHALFSGALFPKNFTKEEKEYSPTNPGVLFGVFKEAGYQTMFQNDLCWKGYYGLFDSLKAYNWTSLQDKIKEANIDSTGITDAACKIIKRYGGETAFHDNEDHQICFNGKHHHKHLFDYLTHYIRAVSSTPQSKPLFSYTETNVAHENVGIRIKTLDQDLVDFIDTISKEQNTITIIFADHGNTYTEYQVMMLEGRLEMYHPILLTILPKQLAAKLGDEIVTNLKTNQHRLLNLLDIRAGLVELARYDGLSALNPAGIFGKISEKRTCGDLQLSVPNYCICEGWDIAVENSTAQLALAEFAIGQLNNQIQDALLASRRHGEPSRRKLFGSCQRLRIQSIGNVRQRQTAEGTLVTTMDARVQSGDIVDQEEMVMLQVESNQRTGKTSYEMKLVSFDRISEYGFYEQCADPGVDLKLCVCNKPETVTSSSTITSSLREVAGPGASFKAFTNPCLRLIKRSYNENVGQEDFVGLNVFEMVNICEKRQFNVTVNSVTENLRSSTELPMVFTLRSRSVYFVTIMMTEVGYYKFKLKLGFGIVSEKDDGGEHFHTGLSQPRVLQSKRIKYDIFTEHN